MRYRPKTALTSLGYRLAEHGDSIAVEPGLVLLVTIPPGAELLLDLEPGAFEERPRVALSYITPPAARASADRAMLNDASASGLEDTRKLVGVRFELRLVDVNEDIEGPDSVGRAARDLADVASIADKELGIRRMLETVTALLNAGFGNVDRYDLARPCDQFRRPAAGAGSDLNGYCAL